MDLKKNILNGKNKIACFSISTYILFKCFAFKTKIKKKKLNKKSIKELDVL